MSPRHLVTLSSLLGQGLLQLLYPAQCLVCGQLLPPAQGFFCPTCRDRLLGDERATCPRCASTVGPFSHLQDGCPHCRATTYHFSNAVRLGIYTGLLREVVLRLKHWSGEGLAERLGELWAMHDERELAALRADAVVAVPLHWRRYWQRGYNQSEALACGLARRLRLPCRSWLRRVRNTPYQTWQPHSSRPDNVRGAFRATAGKHLNGKTILLVDDVLTTGSTASEAARALRDAGAARVVVAVLARAEH